MGIALHGFCLRETEQVTAALVATADAGTAAFGINVIRAYGCHGATIDVHVAEEEAGHAATNAGTAFKIDPYILDVTTGVLIIFAVAMDMIKKVDLSEKEKFEANEKELNFLNRALDVFAARLTDKHNIDKNDYLYLLSTYRTIADFERIGDYSENIMEYAEALKESGESFSEDIIKQIDELDDLINHLCDVTIEVYTGAVSRDNKAAEQLEESIDVLTTKMSEDHIQRMNKGDFSANVGAQYLKLARDVERIGDHLMNINTKDYIVSH